MAISRRTTNSRREMDRQLIRQRKHKVASRRHSDLKFALDCKDIPRESCLTQNRTLLLRFWILSEHRRPHPVVNSESIKRWKLKDMSKAVQKLTKALLALADTPSIWRRRLEEVHSRAGRLLEQKKKGRRRIKNEIGGGITQCRQQYKRKIKCKAVAKQQKRRRQYCLTFRKTSS